MGMRNHLIDRLVRNCLFDCPPLAAPDGISLDIQGTVQRARRGPPPRWNHPSRAPRRVLLLLIPVINHRRCLGRGFSKEHWARGPTDGGAHHLSPTGQGAVKKVVKPVAKSARPCCWQLCEAHNAAVGAEKKITVPPLIHVCGDCHACRVAHSRHPCDFLRPTVTCRFATRHFRRGHVTNHVDSLVCGAKARGGRNESLLESADSRGISHVYQMSDASGF